MEYLMLFGLILLNGLFAMSEIALVTARKGRLSKLAAEGDQGAAVALKLGEDPTRFLSAIQIGITSIGLLNGIVGESVLAKPLADWLTELGLASATAGITATALVVVIVTYVSIVVGELVPKRIGQLSPETIARLVARPMQWLARLTRPFVMLLALSTHGLIRVLGIRTVQHANYAEEEIHALLEEGSESGSIEPQQHDMVRNVFRLDDRQLGSLMIPRSEVVYLDVQAPTAENLQRLIECEHSRVPVCDGTLERVIGVMHARQALAALVRGEEIDLQSNLQPCLYVPETLTGLELLEQFRGNQMQMAFVIDEYGEIEGLVTLQDVLEAVTGEFTPHDAADASALQREDGSWLLDGAIPIMELKDCLHLRQTPEEDKGRYHTLSGMLLLLFGRIPHTGDHVEWQQWRFEIVDMDDKRIDKVLASSRTDTDSP